MAEQPYNDNTAFIPEVYAKKLARVSKTFSKFIERNCNREWEGEIRNFGDVVRIAIPDPTSVTVTFVDGNTDDNDTTTRVPNACPIKSNTKSRETVLEINKAAYFAVEINDIDTAQSQFDLLNGYGAIAMQQVGDGKDKQVMLDLINNTETHKIGTAAGLVEVDAANIYKTVVKMATNLRKAGFLNADGFYSFKGNQEEAEFLKPVLTVGAELYGLMMTSTQLTHPTVAADQVIERGEKGMMAGFEIDVNTVLDTITADEVTGLADGALIAIAATKMAVTYANQITKVEKLRDPQCFADIVRGLELYGYTVVHPKAACIAFLKEKAEA